jgi:NAD+ synthase
MVCFDEKRVFAPGPMPGPIDVRGVRIGVPICEDIWKPDVVECLSETGGRDPAGSQRLAVRDVEGRDTPQHCSCRVVECGLPLGHLNQLGGQDELVFDGASFVLNSDRSLALQMPAWKRPSS